MSGRWRNSKAYEYKPKGTCFAISSSPVTCTGSGGIDRRGKRIFVKLQSGIYSVL